MTQTRRDILTGATALGCSLAASPLLTPVTLAAAPGENRLVVIVLRGAMDGLDVVRPVGDRAYRALRPSLSKSQGWDLDGFYEAHPALSDLQPLWRAGELSFAHAVSTPYRDKRSHFEGQDALESGSGARDGRVPGARDGWLNRVLQDWPGLHSETGFAVGRSEPLILRGSAPVATWAPDGALDLSPQAQALLGEIYGRDPLFAQAAQQAFELAQEPGTGTQGGMSVALARYAAERLRGESRIASFSLGGWDTHIRQEAGLTRSLSALSQAIVTLKAELGPVWGRTCVLAITEFGRTARENGSGGTDHGTGGAMLVAGGVLARAQVVGDCPGLGSSDLYEDRDLRPTRDVRAYLGWSLAAMFGLEASALEAQVFPGLELGKVPKLFA
ncbi:MAG: DUF1501 domain-containing protein [Pseudomonadota bacterium]